MKQSLIVQSSDFINALKLINNVRVTHLKYKNVKYCIKENILAVETMNHIVEISTRCYIENPYNIDVTFYTEMPFDLYGIISDANTEIFEIIINIDSFDILFEGNKITVPISMDAVPFTLNLNNSEVENFENNFDLGVASLRKLATLEKFMFKDDFEVDIQDGFAIIRQPFIFADVFINTNLPDGRIPRTMLDIGVGLGDRLNITAKDNNLWISNYIGSIHSNVNKSPKQNLIKDLGVASNWVAQIDSYKLSDMLKFMKHVEDKDLIYLTIHEEGIKLSKKDNMLDVNLTSIEGDLGDLVAVLHLPKKVISTISALFFKTRIEVREGGSYICLSNENVYVLLKQN